MLAVSSASFHATCMERICSDLQNNAQVSPELRAARNLLDVCWWPIGAQRLAMLALPRPFVCGLDDC